MFENSGTSRLNKIMFAVALFVIGCGAGLCGGQVINEDQPLIATDQQHALVEDGTKMTSAAGTDSVTKGPRTPSLVYQGRLYYFCCQRHMRYFQADPDRYVNNVKPPNGKDIGNIPGMNLMWGQSADRPVVATNRRHALVENGTRMTSPVSGKSISKSPRTPSVIYKDRLYFFCCQADVRKFHANPGRYADSVGPPNGVLIKKIVERNRKRLGGIDKVLIASEQQHRLVKDGTEMFSPVTGKPVTKRYKTPAALHKGKIYYFCCNADARKFAADPDRYIKDVKAPNGQDVTVVAGLNLGSGGGTDQLLVPTNEQYEVVEDKTSLISLVSENPITKGPKTPSAVYKNRIYYFCCNADLRKFQGNPEKYIPDTIPPNGIDITEGLKEVALRKQRQKEAETMVYDIEIGSSPVLGPADAPVTIVEFADFQCPFCVREWPKIKKVLDDYAGKVRLVFKHYPLAFHDKAKPVHAAAEFANMTKGAEAFWKMHDMVIANPKKLDRVTLRGYAESIGLDMVEFDRLMGDAAKIDELLEADLADAGDYTVRGTPAVFINGLKLAPRTPENYRARIDQILGESTQAESSKNEEPEPAQTKQAVVE